MKNYKDKIDKFNFFIHELIKWLNTLESFDAGKISLKSDSTFITELDIKINSKIRDLLNTNLPKVVLVSEENNTRMKDLTVDEVILIDPIDGTENFVLGSPIWGIGLAYFIDGSLRASCVLFPEMRLIHASQMVQIDKNFGFWKLRPGISGYANYLHPANFDKQIFCDRSDKFKDRVLGCSLMNISMTCFNSWTFESSGPGLQVWDFLPAILPALEYGKVVYVNERIYSGQYLSEAKRYHLKIENTL
jgi:myo-inositol-1(or 4)-monophosphatase